MMTKNTDNQPNIPLNMLLNALEKDFGEDSVDFLNIFQPRNSASSRDESDGNSDRVDFWNIF